MSALALWTGLTKMAVLAAAAVAAQPGFASLHVDIWPEHDDPRVLVIYRGTLNSAVSLPYALTFDIPTSGQVNAAAYRAADGQLYSVPYQYRQDGDRLQVTMTIPERGFQFEYYVDAISGLPQRSFSVSLVFPLPADDLRVSVEEPLRSSAFVLAPAADGSTATAAGLLHHLYAVGPWPAGRTWSVRATYRKPDATPSVPRAVAAPGPAPGGPAAVTPSPGTVSGWLWGAAALLGVVGVAVVGVRLGWWRRGGQRTPGRAQGARPAPAVGAHSKEKRRRGGPVRVHCAACGARARSGDRFCSRCGKPLP
ncbi:MAG: zinc ribbon domain-containing protein [Armatimonadota bacterium]|nr:zinc ribbon domain-containing protein [Armatimonadota bacterium]